MIKQMIKGISGMLAAACVIIMSNGIPADAEPTEKTENINGNVYEFSSKDAYTFEDAEISGGTAQIDFSICGDVVSDGEKDGIAVYAVNGENPVSFYYHYDSIFFNAPEEEWHLAEDSSQKINDISLDENIGKGAIILQISNDGKKWVSVSENVNTFEKESAEPFYETTELELLNGCYYRVIAAYEMRRRGEDSQILFITQENYEYKRYAEVAEFYLYDKDNYVGNRLDGVEKVKLGKRIRTEDSGYTGQKDIDKNDPHYGWDLGEFFVSGFTSKNTIDGKQYILKNVGDMVTLGFYLNQDIDKLNGKESLSISRDNGGYDKYFETSPTDFGRGTLIIKYTDPDGVTADPQIYTNYLEANLSPRANTAVRLCEEGDYDVALDYEIQDESEVLFGVLTLPETTHYRIAFQFSVRNSNCMVYTFDNVTGNELKNGNVTEHGFYIDLANSQYLDVSVKKEIWEDGADGLTEDTRFNRKAKDKEVYTDEGIYTITVKNKAAELESEKKIYVGTNRVLKAYMTTGLPIAEIQEKVAQGAEIDENGTIVEHSSEAIESTAAETEETVAETEVEITTQAAEEQSAESDRAIEDKPDKMPGIGIVSAAAVLIIVAGMIKKKKQRIDKNAGDTLENETIAADKNESREEDGDK